jgi:hypothetical protein
VMFCLRSLLPDSPSLSPLPLSFLTRLQVQSQFSSYLTTKSSWLFA